MGRAARWRRRAWAARGKARPSGRLAARRPSGAGWHAACESDPSGRSAMLANSAMMNEFYSTTLGSLLGPSATLAVAATLVTLAVLVLGLALEARAERQRRQASPPWSRAVLAPPPLPPTSPPYAA